jgi:NADH-quinone oxidoreductase subunit N
MTFTFTVPPEDWGRIAPLLVLVGMALIVMLVDLFLPYEGGKRSKHSGPQTFAVLPIVSFLGILGALAAAITLFIVGDQRRAFNEMIGSDWGSLYSYVIILSASGLGILLSPAYLKRLGLVHQGEYYALLLLSTAGMMMMAAATSFVMVFLGIEMLSLALYILCSYIGRRQTSQESGMKYFLLSSFASAFLLYGIALTYGATGNTSFIGVAKAVQQFGQNGAHSPVLLLLAMGLLIVGFAFKISAIPFQAWTPDVYQGAPAPVTAFMSVGTKAAALIAFVRVFGFVLWPVHVDWQPILWVLAVLTIIGGNVLALVQSNVKRLLAYSSIAHAGYLLIGVLVGGQLGASAVLFYLLCYTFMNLGAFGVISLLENLDNSGSDANDLRGLWYRRPVLAGLLAFFLLALAGFPPMAGFAGKYYLFYTSLVGGYPELLVIGVLASVLGMYYYLRTVTTMFMEREKLADVVAGAPQAPEPAATARRTTDRGRTAGQGRGGAATAVAVKPSTSKQTQTAGVPEQPETVETVGKLSWLSWTALGIAALGTLAMGTALPFWLVNIAQQAASMMLR